MDNWQRASGVWRTLKYENYKITKIAPYLASQYHKPGIYERVVGFTIQNDLSTINTPEYLI